MDEKVLKSLLEEILKDMRDIKNDIEKIKGEISVLKGGIGDVQNTCENMDRHIGFVENVYTQVKRPLEFIKGKFEYFSKNTDMNVRPSLPDVERTHKLIL